MQLSGDNQTILDFTRKFVFVLTLYCSRRYQRHSRVYKLGTAALNESSMNITSLFRKKRTRVKLPFRFPKKVYIYHRRVVHPR